MCFVCCFVEEFCEFLADILVCSSRAGLASKAVAAATTTATATAATAATATTTGPLTWTTSTEAYRHFYDSSRTSDSPGDSNLADLQVNATPAVNWGSNAAYPVHVLEAVAAVVQQQQQQQQRGLCFLELLFRRVPTWKVNRGPHTHTHTHTYRAHTYTALTIQHKNILLILLKAQYSVFT